MTTEAVGAAPGWYPDGYGAIRFFDGAAWTTHTRPVPPAAAAAPAAAVAAAPVAAAEVTEDDDAPFYRQGWFLVDVAVLALIVGVIVVASIT